MKFLPDDYKAPVTAGGYMTLATGENRIRILSEPIIGWEDWIDNKPIRYPFNMKPEKSHNSEKPLRHFWSFIVWNYKEEKIQILQISSASIRKTIQDLCENTDWGVPYNYDLVLKKEGEKLTTKYTATPVPPKLISEHIKEAFYEKRINLDALFDGGDPFSIHSSYTEGCFSHQVANKYVSKNESEELLSMFSHCTDDAKKNILSFLTKANVKEDFSNLPTDQYDRIYKSIYKRYLEANPNENSLMSDDI